MKVLISGGGGQLGSALAQLATPDVELVLLSKRELDITLEEEVAERVHAERPDWIINTAAYTAVNDAESRQQRAFAINGDGAGFLARAAAQVNAGFVHISTDYVFDGTKSTPYQPEDDTNPLNVYGSSKLAGERAVLAEMPDALIIRTAWVYAETGQNFVRTVLRLCREASELRVVVDQFGTPTWATSIARAVWRAIARDIHGVHHWVDTGVTSWHDFAVAIQEEALALGLLRRSVPIHAIGSAEYPSPARRPAYSVLDSSQLAEAIELTPGRWRDHLRQMLVKIKVKEAAEA